MRLRFASVKLQRDQREIVLRNEAQIYTPGNPPLRPSITSYIVPL